VGWGGGWSVGGRRTERHPGGAAPPSGRGCWSRAGHRRNAARRPSTTATDAVLRLVPIRAGIGVTIPLLGDPHPTRTLELAIASIRSLSTSRANGSEDRAATCAGDCRCTPGIHEPVGDLALVDERGQVDGALCRVDVVRHQWRRRRPRRAGGRCRCPRSWRGPALVGTAAAGPDRWRSSVTSVA